MSYETPEVLARELKLTTENDGDIYRQRINPILMNLTAKKASGKYDREKAVKLFMYLAEAGARLYAKEFGQGEHEWHTMFPVPVRLLAAVAWRDEFEQNFKNGEYDDLIPKKYKKIVAKPRSSRETPQDKDYHDGMQLAQKISASLSQAEIKSILDRHYVYGAGKKKISPSFGLGYIRRMQQILDASEGN